MDNIKTFIDDNIPNNKWVAPVLIIKSFLKDSKLIRHVTITITIDVFTLIVEPHQISLFKNSMGEKTCLDTTLNYNWTYDEYAKYKNKIYLIIENLYNISIEEYSFNMLSFE